LEFNVPFQVTAQIFTWIDASAYRSYFNVLYFRLCILERWYYFCSSATDFSQSNNTVEI